MFAGCRVSSIASRVLYAISEASGLERLMATWFEAKTMALCRYFCVLGSEGWYPRTSRGVIRVGHIEFVEVGWQKVNSPFTVLVKTCFLGRLRCRLAN
jgi:hypothetical protein